MKSARYVGVRVCVWALGVEGRCGGVHVEVDH